MCPFEGVFSAGQKRAANVGTSSSTSLTSQILPAGCTDSHFISAAFNFG
jgi:hypothetical protein